MVNDMKMLVISDLHRNKNAAVQCSRIAENMDIDTIVVLGDISHNNFEESVSLLKLVSRNNKIFFVPGNMDSRKLLNWTENEIRNIHCKIINLNDELSFLGIGGSTKTPFNTQIEFDEEKFMSMLNEASRKLDGKRFVLISHCPPKDTNVDKTDFGIHGGSSSIRKFIEEKRPIMNICGHIHEAKGIDKIGNTLIINPGAARDGHYATIEIDGEPHYTFNEF